MIYLIRHGQTALNAKKVMQGRIDTHLNETGIEQARAAGGELRRRGVSFDRIYSSPLSRAVETAEEIGRLTGCADIVTDERLLEMDYGPYEGMDLTRPAPEVMEFFGDFAGVPAPEGMEQLSSVVARLGDFLEEHKAEAEAGDILVATHAIAMKGALEYLTPEADGRYWGKYLGNCEVYAAEVRDGVYSVPAVI